MKFTKDERLDIGRRMYNKEITYREAMEMYDISESCAHQYMTDYKKSQGITPQSHNKSSSKVRSTSSEMDIYMEMSKEELINELIKAKANELREKKGYEVKGAGANKEFIPINNKNSK